jgi:2-keto-4-pentenoate hydratase/2-oxohepta-3-ene-1,7-dioic acid hydratase in catechol pathway
MRLCRAGAPGSERPAVVTDAGVFDVSRFGLDYGGAFFAGDGMERLRAFCRAELASCPKVSGGERIGPCIERPIKIVCVGRNYRAHAAETGADVPAEPLLFMKATTAFAGPYDDLVLPRGAERADWEVELAVVIGKAARHVSRERALEHVAGYALMNDYTERGFQRDRGGQWTKGKSADGFAPLGPWLVTPEELEHGSVTLSLSVNGVRRQHASTAAMIFDVPTLIAYVSEFMTLCPGDVLSTGTPEGVGFGHDPPLFLRPGDLVEYEGTGLGSARQRILAHPR